MLTIHYGHAHSQITGTDSTELHLADTLLSMNLTFEVPGFFFSPKYQNAIWDGRKSFYSTTTHKFLSGLLSIVLRILKSTEFEVVVEGYPEEHGKISALAFGPMRLFGDDGNDIHLYDYQMHAVYKIMRYNRGVLRLATNSGKTEVMAAVAKAYNYPPMVCLVPRKEILRQTVDRLKSRLRVTIGMVGDGVWDPNPTGITAVMFQTLVKRYKTAAVKRWLDQVQIVFADECHFLTDEQYQKALIAIPATTIIGMSGTPFKDSRIDEYTVRGLCGPVLCTVGNKALVERGISAGSKVVFLEPKVPWLESKAMEHATWDTTLHTCQYRNKLIGNLGIGFVKCGMQTVIMVNRVKHGLEIQKHCPGAVFVSSQSSNRNKVKARLASGEVFCCICTSIFDTGLSVDHIQAFINAAGGNTMHTLLQRLGRLIRQNKTHDKDSYFVDFWDTFNKITRSHSRDRWEILSHENAFQMMEGPDDLPAGVLTEVTEGAGVSTTKIRKSQKAKFKTAH